MGHSYIGNKWRIGNNWSIGNNWNIGTNKKRTGESIDTFL
jgi:UDP-3-O-[3-hydroxymyristoyl] glucosamine N-acyltransferase